MRLKLDENMPRPLAESLQRAGQHSGAIVLRPRDAGIAAIEALAVRALALAMDIDMTNRIVIFEDERIRIRPPLALVPPQDRS